MYGEIKQLIKHGSIYTVGIVLSRIVSVVMLPVYTRCLNPSQYGVLELLGLTTDLVSTAIGMGMGAAVMRFYFKNESPERRHAVISTALIGVLTVMGVTTTACVLLSAQASQLVFASGDYAYPFRITFLTMFFSASIEIPLILLRVNQKSITFVMISLVKLIIQLGLNIYFLVYLDMGIIGVVYSGLISSVLISAYLVYTTFRHTRIRFDYPIYKEMLGFGAPLIIADLSVFGLTYADHYILSYLGNLAMVGLYALAYKFGMMVSMLFSAPFRTVWATRMFEIANQEDSHKVYGRVVTYFLMGSLAISLGLSCMAKDALKVIAESSYWSAYHIVPIIAASYVAGGLIYIVGVGILIEQRTKLIALSTTVALIVNLVLCFTLIPIWGAYGAALATLIAFMVRCGIDAYNSQRLFAISYEWRRMALTVGFYMLFTLLAIWLQFGNLAISIAFNCLVIAAFPASLWLFGVLTAEEKGFVKYRIQKLLRLAPAAA